jgi:hypothetical protein
MMAGTKSSNQATNIKDHHPQAFHKLISYENYSGVKRQDDFNVILKAD